ncbi:TonB-dependent receptor [Kordiimonas marina]|uniref:TonB-dependent receptor n=1 Tax=Kordiimonas marina TaxID=2872312 RepID=UPI001FF1F51E|nr:TonB-dependent receptor [Kordiimonas marina]MCJ9430285.1 TonB-dependent receptor [Kordiimonas marina]
MKSVYQTRSAMLATGASLVALLGAGQASAQDKPKTLGLEEIVVTAQKRAQSVQDVPIAITAFDGNFTKRVHLDDVKDLVKFAPGFAGNSKDSFIDYINIRGISTNDFGVGGDPSAGFFKNGLYQGRNGVVVSSMFDMERAEVLRGPQGFLFGRNAIGGAISLYTAKPKFGSFGGHVDAGVGERGILEGEVAVNLPMGDDFALRLAGYHSHENGFVTNHYNPNGDKLVAHNKNALRVSAGWRGDKWDATMVGEFEDRNQSGSIYRAINDESMAFLQTLRPIIGRAKPHGADMRNIDSDLGLGNYDRGKIYSGSLEVNYDLDFATLTSNTGYKGHTYAYAEDFDGMPIRYNDYGQNQSGSYFETELRLVSQKGDSPLSWYAGVSYYKETINATFDNASNPEVLCAAYYEMSCSDLYAYWGYGDFTANPNGHHERNRVAGKYKGWGAYVDFTYAVTDKFELDAGVRYTKDTKHFGIDVLPVHDELGPFFMFGYTTDGFVYGDKSWDDFTPRFIARYRPNDSWMIYASATKGYKSGGFGSFAVLLPNGMDDNLVANPGATPDAFNPEKVWSYEIGAKGDMFDKKLRLDFAGYHYRYTDLQINYWDAGTKVANVGTVNAWGLEASAQAILGPNFDLFVSGSYNHNKIHGADQIVPGSDGHRLGGTPEWIASGVLTFHTPVKDKGEANASVEFRTQTSTFGGLDNAVEAINPGWTDVTFRMGFDADAGWSVTGYVENVFNALYFDGTGEASFPFPAHYFGASRPRTFGVKFSYKFGDE